MASSCQRASTSGPVPVRSSGETSVSDFPCKRWLGKILSEPMYASAAQNGSSKATWTVREFGALTADIGPNSAAGVMRISGSENALMVNTASSALKLVPSCHLTSERSVNVIVLPSADTRQLSASPGVSEPSFGLTFRSESNNAAETNSGSAVISPVAGRSPAITTEPRGPVRLGTAVDAGGEDRGSESSGVRVKAPVSLMGGAETTDVAGASTGVGSASHPAITPSARINMQMINAR